MIQETPTAYDLTPGTCAIILGCIIGLAILACLFANIKARNDDFDDWWFHNNDKEAD